MSNFQRLDPGTIGAFSQRAGHLTPRIARYDNDLQRQGARHLQRALNHYIGREAYLEFLQGALPQPCAALVCEYLRPGRPALSIPLPAAQVARGVALLEHCQPYAEGPFVPLTDDDLRDATVALEVFEGESQRIEREDRCQARAVFALSCAFIFAPGAFGASVGAVTHEAGGTLTDVALAVTAGALLAGGAVKIAMTDPAVRWTRQSQIDYALHTLCALILGGSSAGAIRAVAPDSNLKADIVFGVLLAYATLFGGAIMKALFCRR